MRTSSETPTHRDSLVKEGKEVPHLVETEIMDADGLIKIVFGKDLTPHPRFKSPDQGGVFKLFRPEYLIDKSLSGNAIFCVSKEDGVVVGIGKLLKHESVENAYYLTSVSVDPEYSGKGCARKILEGFFQLAKEKDYTLISPGYKEEGLQKLKHIDEELSKKYGVRWISDEEYETKPPEEWFSN